MLDKQGSLGLDVDPAFVVADVNAKSKELSSVCSPIVHKPKPKPKEEPKDEEKAEQESAKKDPDAMDTDEGEKKEGDKMEVDEA